MPCPLCRAEIVEHATDVRGGTREPIDDGVLSAWIDVRDAYLERLRGKSSKTAGYVDRSRLARSIASTFGDALQQAVVEREGTERMAREYALERVGDDELVVRYKRTPRSKTLERESYEYFDKEALRELEGATTELDVATYDPHVFFLLKYHYDGDVEAGLRDVGLLQSKRRRVNN